MKIGITIGDVNGIGIEVMIKSLRKLYLQNTYHNTKYIIFGNSKSIAEYLKFNYITGKVQNYQLILDFGTFNIYEIEKYSPVELGKVSAAAGKLAAESVIIAAKSSLNNEIDAIVTMPLNKESIHLAGIEFPGHTELIASLCGINTPLMVLFENNFRVALLTIHEPLRCIPDLITKERIYEISHIFANSLINDFGVTPKVAVLGLNPHAGENGDIGTEEKEIISPALVELSKQGLDISGPFAADGFFARHEHLNYNGIIAMYHDQGLIPLKFASKGNGVNFTSGLPIIRTSPDHGTAFSLAGKNMADETSAYQAIIAAIEIYENRKRLNKVYSK
jgi:4-hydroxythreonine-4-phosphate dehydrogenase